MSRRRVFTSRCGVISPQHVTLPSRILMYTTTRRRAVGKENDHRNHQRNHQRTTYWSPRHRVIDHFPYERAAATQTSEPPPRQRAINRAILRAIRRASRHHGAGNDPNDTPYAEPTPRTASNDERDDGQSGAETEGYVRGSRV